MLQQQLALHHLVTGEGAAVLDALAGRCQRPEPTIHLTWSAPNRAAASRDVRTLLTCSGIPPPWREVVPLGGRVDSAVENR